MAKTTKIPKRIAGVKLPKDLRKAGNALIERAQSPEGRQVLTAGLAMAATAATAALAKRAQTPPEPARPAPEAPDAPPQGTQSAPDPQAMADAFMGAAERALGQFFGKRV
ncbi:hypothetical protein [Sphingomonas sp. CROZ-RG-20F-R02-07]|uniref:hypothetical protein n=1 Tax=Sphingomonas sp. CROZ-RG-20F-R02-07 TaxID=2914832 RepID=UPI001F58A92D|nr:hypothetical protein [Sphingomonas sp. CROZ-RG-20F-R02-07]